MYFYLTNMAFDYFPSFGIYNKKLNLVNIGVLISHAECLVSQFPCPWRQTPQTLHSRWCHVVWSPHHPWDFPLLSCNRESPLSKYRALRCPRKASIFNGDTRLDANCYESLVVCSHQEYGYILLPEFFQRLMRVPHVIKNTRLAP